MYVNIHTYIYISIVCVCVHLITSKPNHRDRRPLHRQILVHAPAADPKIFQQVRQQRRSVWPNRFTQPFKHHGHPVAMKSNWIKEIPLYPMISRNNRIGWSSYFTIWIPEMAFCTRYRPCHPPPFRDIHAKALSLDESGRCIPGTVYISMYCMHKIYTSRVY